MNSRIVRDITELTQVVLDALGTLQDQALQSHGWSTLMWNRWDEEATDGWWPVWEDHLSNLLCAFLREHLTTRKPVINREVEIQPPKRDGGITDIHVQAPDPGDTVLQPLTAIIEVKGCWNTQIRTGIPKQLIPYLQPRPGWAGIFLVGHFHQPGHEHENYTGWPATSERRKNAGRHRTSKKHTPEQILRDLQEQIANAPAGIIVHARVVQFPLIPPPALAEVRRGAPVEEVSAQIPLAAPQHSLPGPLARLGGNRPLPPASPRPRTDAIPAQAGTGTAGRNGHREQQAR